MKFILVNSWFIVFSTMISSICFAGYIDGTYDATVRTDSGSYTVPVEVEGGEVSHVDWPNGGNMTVQGADLDDAGEADGTNLNGDAIHIELDNPDEAKEKDDDEPSDN